LSNEAFVLDMQDIGKEYFGNRVLSAINLQLKPGEIHGIVGENGAGKSTLMNILFGMSVIHSTGGYEGKIRVSGKEAQIKSPLDAMNLGIGMVHQEFMLIPGYTITENIKLNREITKPNLASRIVGKRYDTLDVVAMRRDARKALDKLDMSIDEWATIAGLPVGYMQFVEIARELDKTNLKVLVFDEPTAVLTESEADNLLDAMRVISNHGIAILFITHRLHEIMTVCENITVLRDGKMVAQRKKDETNIYELAELMVGSRVGEVMRKPREDVTDEKPILTIRNLSVEMPGEEVSNVSLDIHKGEIIGIGGLAGQGKIGVANGIMGLFPAEGEVVFDGKQIELNNPTNAMMNSLAFVSEDRRGVGLLLDSSIENNIAFTAIQRQGKYLKKFGPFTQLDKAAVRQTADRMIKELDIRCTGPTQITRRLSGGNQQKVCIARALMLEPKLLFVSEPTRGIDVGAKKLVLQTLVELSEKYGLTVVMTSSELAELRSVCDRIAIVTEGKIAGILKPTDTDVDFGLMMAGEKHDNA
jgi:simple sugar transport system ATP-binding protein